MKAIHIPQFTPSPSTLLPTTIPTPVPTSSEYLIRVTHCSPQHADILHAKGKHQNNNAKRGWCHPPFVLGFDFAGIIQSCPDAPSTSNLKRGDRVFGAALGAFAEYVCAPEGSIRKIPDRLSAETAAAMSGQAVSYASVTHIAKVQPGETVLVSGASGGLGSVCCMVSKAVGARVIALAGDETKAARMRLDMADCVDLVLVMDAAGAWTQQVLDFTGGEGAQVCLDNTGMVNEAIRCLAYFGRIVILGFAARGGEMESVKMNRLLLKSITVVGYRFGESGRRFPDVLEDIWRGYLGLLEEGRVRPVIFGRGEYKGLESVGRALGDLEARRVYGKIVVRVAEEAEGSRL